MTIKIAKSVWNLTGNLHFFYWGKLKHEMIKHSKHQNFEFKISKYSFNKNETVSMVRGSHTDHPGA